MCGVSENCLKEDRMNWKALLCAFVVSVGLAGCGGGGGGGANSTPVPTSDPLSEVKSLDSQLTEAISQKNLNRTMGFYSDRYFDNEGNTKDDVRAIYQAIFQNFDVLSSQTLAENATIAADGSVILGAGGTLTLKDRRDGTVSTLTLAGANRWGREGGTWRIVSNSAELVNAMKKIIQREL